MSIRPLSPNDSATLSLRRQLNHFVYPPQCGCLLYFDLEPNAFKWFTAATYSNQSHRSADPGASLKVALRATRLPVERWEASGSPPPGGTWISGSRRLWAVPGPAQVTLQTCPRLGRKDKANVDTQAMGRRMGAKPAPQSDTVKQRIFLSPSGKTYRTHVLLVGYSLL